MIIENPTYEDLCKYLGRTVTVVGKTRGTATGCLVHTCVSHEVFAAVANGSGIALICDNLNHDQSKHVGPKDIYVHYIGDPTSIIIHEPKGDFTQKKWMLLAAPLLLKVLWG